MDDQTTYREEFLRDLSTASRIYDMLAADVFVYNIIECRVCTEAICSNGDIEKIRKELTDLARERGYIPRCGRPKAWSVVHSLKLAPSYAAPTRLEAIVSWLVNEGKISPGETMSDQEIEDLWKIHSSDVNLVRVAIVAAPPEPYFDAPKEIMLTTEVSDSVVIEMKERQE